MAVLYGVDFHTVTKCSNVGNVISAMGHAGSLGGDFGYNVAFQCWPRFQILSTNPAQGQKEEDVVGVVVELRLMEMEMDLKPALP